MQSVGWGSDSSFLLAFRFRAEIKGCAVSPLHRGKVILGYTDSELCRGGSGYQFIHAADMMYCAENHVRSEFQRRPAGLTLPRGRRARPLHPARGSSPPPAGPAPEGSERGGGRRRRTRASSVFLQ